MLMIMLLRGSWPFLPDNFECQFTLFDSYSRVGRWGGEREVTANCCWGLLPALRAGLFRLSVDKQAKRGQTAQWAYWIDNVTMLWGGGGAEGQHTLLNVGHFCSLPKLAAASSSTVFLFWQQQAGHCLGAVPA